jgi:hypothetical protein
VGSRIQGSVLITVKVKDNYTDEYDDTNTRTLTIPFYREYELTFEINSSLLTDNDDDIVEIYLNGDLTVSFDQSDLSAYTTANLFRTVTYRDLLSSIGVKMRDLGETTYDHTRTLLPVRISASRSSFDPETYSAIRYIRFNSYYNWLYSE